MAHKLFIFLIAIGLTPVVGFTSAYSGITPVNDEGLLEVGHATNIREDGVTSSDLKIISYNIRWRSGNDLQKLIAILKTDEKLRGALVLGLQEVDRDKKRSGNANTAKILADALGMYYAWAAPPSPTTKGRKEEEETGVAILSAYPLTDVRRIVLPHEGPAHRRRVALGATILIGKTKLRFYSVHSETRVSIEKKLDQLQAVLADLKNHPAVMPAMIVGDFNTWEQEAVKKTSKLFREHHFQTPFDEQTTFARRVLFVPIELKLDWIWLRNLEAREFGIENSVTLSDHWPLWISLRPPATRFGNYQNP